MPLNGNTYVAPTWRNGQPPALDATELQAISDSIVRNQTDNANQDSLIAALQTAVSALQTGKAQIEVGSYVGTGATTASNPCSIMCAFEIKMLWITFRQAGGYVYALFPTKSNCLPFTFGSILTETYQAYKGLTMDTTRQEISNVRKSDSGRTIQWYNSNEDAGFNNVGYTFTFVAFG